MGDLPQGARMALAGLDEPIVPDVIIAIDQQLRIHQIARRADMGRGVIGGANGEVIPMAQHLFAQAGVGFRAIMAVENAEIEIFVQPQPAVAFGHHLDRDAGIAQQKLANMRGKEGRGEIAVDEDADDIGRGIAGGGAAGGGGDLIKGLGQALAQIAAGRGQPDGIAETVHQGRVQHLLQLFDLLADGRSCDA